MERRAVIVVAVALGVAALLGTGLAQQYSAWGPPVHLNPGVNSDWADMAPVITRDGLSLYFSRGSNKAGGAQPLHQFVAHRASVDELWGQPVYLGPVFGDGMFVSTDGHRAYFSRVAANGSKDLYVSRRRDEDDDSVCADSDRDCGGWRAAEDLGREINTDANENYPTLFEDETTGETRLYFTSDRDGTEDIFVSTVQPDGTFSDPVAVPELNSSAIDRQLHIRRDGLECVFTSNRDGSIRNVNGNPSLDLWVATRASIDAPWSTPENMGLLINTGRHEAAPYYSFDGSQLYFHGAQRPGNIDPAGAQAGLPCDFSPTCYFDILVVTREKPHEN